MSYWTVRANRGEAGGGFWFGFFPAPVRRRHSVSLFGGWFTGPYNNMQTARAHASSLSHAAVWSEDRMAADLVALLMELKHRPGSGDAGELLGPQVIVNPTPLLRRLRELRESRAA